MTVTVNGDPAFKHPSFRRNRWGDLEGTAILKAVARAEQTQEQVLEALRYRAWQVFLQAGCPNCRAHDVVAMGPAERVKLLGRGRLIASLLKKNFCNACGLAW